MSLIRARPVFVWCCGSGWKQESAGSATLRRAIGRPRGAKQLVGFSEASRKLRGRVALGLQASAFVGASKPTLVADANRQRIEKLRQFLALRCQTVKGNKPVAERLQTQTGKSFGVATRPTLMEAKACNMKQGAPRKEAEANDEKLLQRKSAEGTFVKGMRKGPRQLEECPIKFDAHSWFHFCPGGGPSFLLFTLVHPASEFRGGSGSSQPPILSRGRRPRPEAG